MVSLLTRTLKARNFPVTVNFAANYRRITGLNSFVLVIYTLINLLFIWKYSPDFGLPSWAVMLLFLAVELLLLWLFHLNIRLLESRKFFIVVSLIIAASLVIILIKFDPAVIKVGRYPAIVDWLNRILRGDFPYQSATNPSGFPFLYLLVLPFYLLGDVGIFQIFSFLLFVSVEYQLFPEKVKTRYLVLSLLIISPVYLYEIAVRSELFSNMAVFLAYFLLLSRCSPRWMPLSAAVIGLAGGLILSTRGIILLLFLLLFPILLKNQVKNLSIYAACIILGFLLTLIPFLIWNSGYFLNYGPFAIQTSYLPKGCLALLIALSIFWGTRLNDFREFLPAAGILLFVVVLVAFAISVMEAGFEKSVRGDYFDISYFCLTLPFLLLTLGDMKSIYALADNPPPNSQTAEGKSN